MKGILLVDKPVGLSSQAVISKIKKILNVKKIGHAGTLDPLASGVLVVLLNEATKLSNYLLEEEKEYVAEITIGKTTDTLDSEGKVISQKEVKEAIDVDKLLNSFIGKYMQEPPMYSALKYNGIKLYDLARQGIDIERKRREVEIKEIKRISDVYFEDGIIKFSFLTKVSKGTYIRSLCFDIGARANFPAYMSKLRRISSGKFSIENCYSLDDISKGNYKLINMIEAINLPIWEIDCEKVKRVLNGNPFQTTEIELNDNTIAISYNGELLAIYEKQEEIYKAVRVWN